jgi:hypothetical protein
MSGDPNTLQRLVPKIQWLAHFAPAVFLLSGRASAECSIFKQCADQLIFP